MFHIIPQDNDRVIFPAHDEILQTIKFFNLVMTGSIPEISKFLLGSRKSSTKEDTLRLGNNHAISGEFYSAEAFPELSRRRSSSIASLPTPISVCEVDVNVTNTLQQNALHIACSRIYKSNTPILENSTSRRFFLSQLQSENALNLVKVLVQYGVSVNAKDCLGRTPLMYACYYGASDIISFLILELVRQRQKHYESLTNIKQCSEVYSQENIGNEILSIQDYRGCTALHYVIRSQSLNALNAMRLSLAKISFHSSSLKNPSSTPGDTIAKAFSALKTARPSQASSILTQQPKDEEKTLDENLLETITLLEDDDSDDYMDNDREYSIEFTNTTFGQLSLSPNQISLFKRGNQAADFMSSFTISHSILEIENKDGNTALHEALLYPESCLARELLLAGAKPPLPHPYFDAITPHVPKDSVIRPVDAPLIAIQSLPKVIVKKLKGASISSLIRQSREQIQQKSRENERLSTSLFDTSVSLTTEKIRNNTNVTMTSVAPATTSLDLKEVSSSMELSYISILNSIQNSIVHPVKTTEIDFKNINKKQTPSQTQSQSQIQDTLVTNCCFNSSQSVFPRCPDQSVLQHSLSGLFIDTIAYDLYHACDNVSSTSTTLRSHQTSFQTSAFLSSSTSVSPPYSSSPSFRYRHLSSEYLEIVSWFKVLTQSQKIASSISMATTVALSNSNVISSSTACCEFHFALGKLVLLYLYITEADISFTTIPKTTTKSSSQSLLSLPSLPSLPQNLSSFSPDSSSFLGRVALDELVVLSRIYPDDENENINVSRLARSQSFSKSGFSFPSPKQQNSLLSSSSRTKTTPLAFDGEDCILSPQDYRLTELKFSTSVSAIFKAIANKTPTTSQVLSVLSVLPDLSIDALFSCLIHQAVSQTNSIASEENHLTLVENSWHGRTKGTFHLFSRLHISSFELWVSLREHELRAKNLRIHSTTMKSVDNTLRQQAIFLARQWRDQQTQTFLSQQPVVMAVGPKERNRERELEFLRFEEAIDCQMYDKERELYACLVRQSILESEMRQAKSWREELEGILSNRTTNIPQSCIIRPISYNKAEDYENW